MHRSAGVYTDQVGILQRRMELLLLGTWLKFDLAGGLVVLPAVQSGLKRFDLTTQSGDVKEDGLLHLVELLLEVLQ